MVNNPIHKEKDGWYWGSVGPQPTRELLMRQVRAIYASGYSGHNPLVKNPWKCAYCGTPIMGSRMPETCPVCHYPFIDAWKYVGKNPLTLKEREQLKNWGNMQFAISRKYSNTDPVRAEFYHGRSVAAGKIAKQFNPKLSKTRTYVIMPITTVKQFESTLNELKKIDKVRRGANMKNPKQLIIAGIPMKHDPEFGSYFGKIKPEPYNTGKDKFVPSFRTIYVSSEMYPGTDKNFIYITSNIHGKMRKYRTKNWYETEIANIYASGKTLKEAIEKFEHNFKNKIYNIRGNNPKNELAWVHGQQGRTIITPAMKKGQEMRTKTRHIRIVSPTKYPGQSELLAKDLGVGNPKRCKRNPRSAEQKVGNALGGLGILILSLAIGGLIWLTNKYGKNENG